MVDAPYPSKWDPAGTCDQLWRSLRESARAAVAGEDPSAVTAAARSMCRALALSTAIHMPQLLECLQAGFQELTTGLDDAGQERLDWVRLEVLEAAAAGFAEGMEQHAEGLRRRLEALEPEPESRALRPGQTAQQLDMELQRCERMQLPLGLIGLARCLPVEYAGVLRKSLRRYDLVGRLDTGGVVACLPDVARAGLLAAAERVYAVLNEGEQVTHACDLRLALLHFDSADLDVSEMLQMLDRVVAEAAQADDYICWG